MYLAQEFPEPRLILTYLGLLIWEMEIPDKGKFQKFLNGFVLMEAKYKG